MRFPILPCPPETTTKTALPTNTAPSYILAGRCFPWRSPGIESDLLPGAVRRPTLVRLLIPSGRAEEGAPP